MVVAGTEQKSTVAPPIVGLQLRSRLVGNDSSGDALFALAATRPFHASHE
jgi:hypothetical protein